MSSALTLLWIIPLSIAAGEKLAALLQFPRIEAGLHELTRSLRKKLNRARRSASTRAWRGVIAFFMLAIPGLLLGLLLSRDEAWVSLLAALLLVAIFGHILRPHTLYRLLQQARAGKLSLQIAAPDFLFADTHALLRYVILNHIERFSALFIGSVCCYLLGGMAAVLIYLALALSAAHYTPRIEDNKVFGGAVDSLWRIVSFLPRLIASMLLWLAAIFVPGCHPFTALGSLTSADRSFSLFLATLIDIAFGGPIPSAAGEYTLPWLGVGSPKPAADHLARWLALAVIATLIFIIILALLLLL